MVTRPKHDPSLTPKRRSKNEECSASMIVARDRDFSSRQGSATTAMPERIG
jgi:hypothetical protein